MALSPNERIVLQAIRDDVFDTLRAVSVATGLPYQAVRYNCWKMTVGGLLDGFELTYAGHKALANEPMADSDLSNHVDIRPTK